MPIFPLPTPTRRPTFEVYLDALSPIAAMLEVPKPGFLAFNDTIDGTDPSSFLKTCKEITKAKVAHDARVKRRQEREDNFALQDVFEKFVDDPASFPDSDATPTEATQPTIEASQAVRGASHPVVGHPTFVLEPPEPALGSPQCIVDDHQPSIESLHSSIQSPPKSPTEPLDPLTEQVDPPAKPLDPPADVPDFFWLTKPDGTRKLMPFFDHDVAGFIKINITTNHDLPDIDAVRADHFPGLCDHEDTSKPYRILVSGSHDLIKVFGEKQEKALKNIGETLTRILFPGGRKRDFKLQNEGRGFKMGWTSPKSGKCILKPRLVFDYLVPDHDMEPTVIIVNMKLTRPALEVTILHQENVEKKINDAVEELLEKERKEGETQKRPWANDEKEMEDAFAEIAACTTGAVDFGIAVEEREDTRKRARTNDEDGVAEETAQSNKRQKRAHQKESLEGEIVESAEESESSVSGNSLKEWMSEPTVTVHGMDDFNLEEWV